MGIKSAHVCGTCTAVVCQVLSPQPASAVTSNAALAQLRYHQSSTSHLDEVGEVAGILGRNVSWPEHAEDEAIRAALHELDRRAGLLLRLSPVEEGSSRQLTRQPADSLPSWLYANPLHLRPSLLVCPAFPCSHLHCVNDRLGGHTDRKLGRQLRLRALAVLVGGGNGGLPLACGQANGTQQIQM